MLKSIVWEKDKLKILDQTKLPEKEEYILCKSYKDVASAICEMRLRGAPLIGVAAAYGIVLGAMELSSLDFSRFVKEVLKVINHFEESRPTAKNLFFATDRMRKVLNKANSTKEAVSLFLEEAESIRAEDALANRKIGEFGQILIRDGSSVMTHCNAGALATSEYGTALGVIRAAKERGKNFSVYACETRPLLQGARLTTFELKREGIRCILITDSMACYMMSRRKIELVLVGADRVARNGDVANKIGTYMLAVCAKYHNIPFYVAAPLSTFDKETETGSDIPIEKRKDEEVTHIFGKRIAASGVCVENPSFDVTPSSLISGIITEKGIIYPPFSESFKKIFKG